jgi:hypothetical protein
MQKRLSQENTTMRSRSLLRRSSNLLLSRQIKSKNLAKLQAKIRRFLATKKAKNQWLRSQM